MPRTYRSLAFVLYFAAGLTLFACQSQKDQARRKTETSTEENEEAQPDASEVNRQVERRLTVKQDPGKVFYWVAPGPRKLSPKVFGKPGNLNEKMTLEYKIKQARKKVQKNIYPSTVPELLKNLPILVGLPKKGWQSDMIVRGTWDQSNRKLKQNENGNYFLTTPTFFSNIAYPVPPRPKKKNHFRLTYIDRIKKDVHEPGKTPVDTPDDIKLDITFHDPDGNRYDLEIFHVVMPPIPGYKTGGGVLIDSHHHGLTHTGSPLMPKVYTYGAYWAIGRLSINGNEPITRITHAMTTEVVRDKEYKLVTGEQMPLNPKDRIVQTQNHHTHLVVIPVKPTFNGPVYAPFKTGFTVREGRLKGKKQPYIHIMFEQDKIVDGKEHLKNLPARLKD